jgi:hypothetical protein
VGEADYTALRRDQLLAEHDALTVCPDDTERMLLEARAKYPNARVYFDPEVDEAVVDLSSGR